MFLVRAFTAERLRFIPFIPFKTYALGIAILLPLFLTLAFVFCPFLMVMVSRHVRARAVVRTPLQSRTRLRALDCVPNFGVPPVLAFFAFLSSLLGILRILAFATSLWVTLFDLLLEVRDLGGEGDDLGICSTSFLPTPFCNHVAIKDVEIIDDCVLIGLLARDPSVLGRANVQGESFFGRCLSSTKQLGEQLVILAEVITFFGINLLLD